jgi:transcriptional regulator of acetoin/glycerol metabolism
MDLAQDVERVLQDSVARRERILLDAYMAENGDTRHPLVALNEHMIITNATAARLLDSVDQAMLWEHACRLIQQRRAEPHPMVLTDGAVVSVACREVLDAAETIGAVLKIRPAREPRVHRSRADPMPVLGRLAGKGRRWRETCLQAQQAGSGWAMIAGERGTGKLAVAQAMAGDAPVQVIDAAEAAAAGARDWLRELREHLALASPGTVLVIRHADDLDLSAATAAAGLLRDHRDGPVRVIATASRRARHGSPDPLLAEFASVIDVPPLRDRLEDLPALLDTLTYAACGYSGHGARQIHWVTDTVQALTRLDWPGNVASLEALVRELVRANQTGYISANDLPPDVLAQASRRKLAGLEQAEATAIIEALRAAGGNKNRAADNLGIARSTLYRKMRALGLNLSTMTF